MMGTVGLRASHLQQPRSVPRGVGSCRLAARPQVGRICVVKEGIPLATPPRRPGQPHAAESQGEAANPNPAAAAAANVKAIRQTSSHDVPGEGIVRLMSPQEYEAAVNRNPDRLAVVMVKSKSCRPCRAFNKKYSKVADKLKDRVDFYEIYGDETSETIKLVMKMKVKATPNFRFYKGGEEIHQHSGPNEETLTQNIYVHM